MTGVAECVCVLWAVRLVPSTAHLVPAQTLGAISGAMNAGAIGCVHSNWGPAPPCNQSGPANALLTCTGQQPSFAPRAVWHVFAAYANTTGVNIPAQRHCDDCTALCSWDAKTRTVQMLVGYYNGWKCNPATGKCIALAAPASRMLRVDLAGIENVMDRNRVTRPQRLETAGGRARARIHMIPDTGSAPLPAPLPIYDGLVPVASQGLALELNATVNGVFTVTIQV